MNNQWLKKDNETVKEFIKRMVFAKMDGTYDGTYSEWISLVFGKEHSEDVARREFYGCKMLVLALEDEVEDKDDNLTQEDIFKELQRRE